MQFRGPHPSDDFLPPNLRLDFSLRDAGKLNEQRQRTHKTSTFLHASRGKCLRGQPVLYLPIMCQTWWFLETFAAIQQRNGWSLCF